ncbi:conjugative transposon protein TraM [Sediminibacterium ginsengisoli]|uniref:Bacteroides conjugative transposon TraM protein n=1 Tax=Sediminibacterium ginsengisoli TaxID=413434 RepID=A0A1T4NXD7_9BACT|nr:conjugative transposon protein TraM [Sediminibacterium ginsengisoli]SJZ83696.1 Bacteroides conjugative transposon TraM protein [Sediminibacterium ginsengisoli]
MKIGLGKDKVRFGAFLAVISLIFIGVLWLIFSASISDDGKRENNAKGLNMLLPQPNLTGDSANDKMSFYATAFADSIKRSEAIRNDPNRQDTIGRDFTLPMLKNEKDPLEVKVNLIRRKISAIDEETPIDPVVLPKQKVVQSFPDPEIEAINEALDKIMAIQHPGEEPVKEGISEKVYRVVTANQTDETYFGRKKTGEGKILFHDDAEKKEDGGLVAVIPIRQELFSGATVKLELVTGITINGIYIPAGTPIYGIGNIDGERLHIHIPSVRYAEYILPVSISVFDMDGLEGVFVPGSVMRDVVKASADNAVQSTSLGGAGLTLQTQVAAAGIGAAKSLFSKKVRQVRVIIGAGYKVLLRDNKEKRG